MSSSAEAGTLLAPGPQGPEDGPNEFVVEARGLGKVYDLGQLASLMRSVHIVKAKLTGREPERIRFEALKDINFRIAPGECFGCLGRNGSGKSTLLSILAEISVPTSGSVEVRGRVAPLLHVNAGFHLDLTGKENVMLLGTILGLGKAELQEAIPRIAEFAELDRQHMETPVGRFSTGMQSRLGFATVLQLPADIYILDEVLAAADDSFKARCVAEVQRLVAAGRSVIFVSHELPLVRSICNRGLWLHGGQVRAIGDIDEVADAYAEGQRAGIV
jgi:lipopolysaccharide transport system ATP-binding protein